MSRLPDLPRTSRAMVLRAYDEPLVMTDLPLPDKLAAGSLLVRVEVATICGTDVHLHHGDLRGALPAIPGHEMVGTVVAMGEDAATDSLGRPLDLGDRICFTHASCGRCDHCRLDEQPTLCLDRQYYTLTDCSQPPYLVGGYAEYCYVFPNSGRVRVPDDVKSTWASAASCALRTVVHAFDRLGPVKPWQTLVIQGAGPLGLFATAMADHHGVGRIIVIGGPEHRLGIARRYGATDTVSLADAPDAAARVSAIRQLTGGRGAEAVMEFSGARGAFEEGVEMTREGGRFVVVGQLDGPANTAKIRPGYVTRQQLSILGTWSGHVAEYFHALRFLSQTQDKYDFDLLVPTEYALQDANLALDDMRAGRAIKPVLVPGASTRS